MSNTPRTDAQYDFFTALRVAKERVKACPLYRRFIHGTPLSNDIAVWIAVAYCEGANFARQLERELAEARKEREQWADECDKNAALLKEAVELGELAMRQRDTLAEAMTEYMDHHIQHGFVTTAETIKAWQALVAVKGGKA